MKKSILDLMNQQINKELFSAYLYLDFSNYLMDRGLAGFANWFRVQAQEELAHAMLFYDYVHHNNEATTLEAIEKPNVKVNSIMDVLQESLKHEEFITASINDIYAEALKEKDFRSTQFLDWFTKEQGEEEANVHELIDKLTMLGEDKQGLYVMNAELLTRVYVAPDLVIS